MLNSKANNNASPINRLAQSLDEELNQVTNNIINNLQSEVKLIPQLAGHLIKAGGKRFRPMLTLISAKLLKYQGNRHIQLAACIEFIHTATLLHDDVVDESNLRRGLSSANAVWGNQASVLVGDFLFAKAFQIMVNDGSLQVIKLLANASATLAEGEILQLHAQNNKNPKHSENIYLKIINAKTATLFAAACATAALINDRDENSNEYSALYQYGTNLGMAFQIIDDCLDYQKKSNASEKSIGNDFNNGKITLPLIITHQNANKKEQNLINKTIKQNKQKGDWENILELMDKYNAIQKTQNYAENYANSAKQALQHFPNSPEKTIMDDILDFCINRQH